MLQLVHPCQRRKVHREGHGAIRHMLKEPLLFFPVPVLPGILQRELGHEGEPRRVDGWNDCYIEISVLCDRATVSIHGTQAFFPLS